MFEAETKFFFLFRYQTNIKENENGKKSHRKKSRLSTNTHMN